MPNLKTSIKNFQVHLKSLIKRLHNNSFNKAFLQSFQIANFTKKTLLNSIGCPETNK